MKSSWFGLKAVVPLTWARDVELIPARIDGPFLGLTLPPSISMSSSLEAARLACAGLSSDCCEAADIPGILIVLACGLSCSRSASVLSFLFLAMASSIRDEAVWKLADDEDGETTSRALFLLSSSSTFRPGPSLPGDGGALRFDVLRLPDAEPAGDAGTETPPVMIDVNGVKTALLGLGASIAGAASASA
jgi:hypothetical protein